MLEKLHANFRILALGPPATPGELVSLSAHFPHIPREYLSLVLEATEVELQWDSTDYFRIWGPTGCIEMDQSYDISRRIPDAFPIGDDGGGQVIFYFVGASGHGLYSSGYGNLDPEDARWLAPGLTDFLAGAFSTS